MADHYLSYDKDENVYHIGEKVCPGGIMFVKTLREMGLDFADAKRYREMVFHNPGTRIVVTIEDSRWVRQRAAENLRNQFHEDHPHYKIFTRYIPASYDGKGNVVTHPRQANSAEYARALAYEQMQAKGHAGILVGTVTSHQGYKIDFRDDKE